MNPKAFPISPVQATNGPNAHSPERSSIVWENAIADGTVFFFKYFFSVHVIVSVRAGDAGDGRAVGRESDRGRIGGREDRRQRIHRLSSTGATEEKPTALREC